MDLKTFYTSKKVKYALIALVCLVVVLFIFEAGVTVGIHRADFSGHLGDNYSRIFDGDHGAGMMTPKQPLGYGASGTVVSVAGNTLTIAGSDNIEKVVAVGPETIVRRLRETATTSDIKIGDSVIVVGSPLPSGEISAALIRLVPNQPTQ